MVNRPIPTRILGIDYGLTRIGLALSDERKIIASSLTTLLAEKKSEHTAKKIIEKIDQIQKEQNCIIDEIVIGLPLMMSGKTGFLADEVKHIVALLGQLTTIPIRMWDERLTTVQAERSLREASMTRKKRSKKIDAICAIIILQCYLDSRC